MECDMAARVNAEVGSVWKERSREIQRPVGMCGSDNSQRNSGYKQTLPLCQKMFYGT